jgi:hypothetical protein
MGVLDASYIASLRIRVYQVKTTEGMMNLDNRRQEHDPCEDAIACALTRPPGERDLRTSTHRIS